MVTVTPSIFLWFVIQGTSIRMVTSWDSVAELAKQEDKPIHTIRFLVVPRDGVSRKSLQQHFVLRLRDLDVYLGEPDILRKSFEGKLIRMAVKPPRGPKTLEAYVTAADAKEVLDQMPGSAPVRVLRRVVVHAIAYENKLRRSFNLI